MTDIDTSGFVEGPPAGIRTKRIYWRDLQNFVQGYIPALMAEVVLEHNSLIPHVPLRFSDLAPETLAEILNDCASFESIAAGLGTSKLGNVHGGRFWRGRNDGSLRQTAFFAAFPPLTPYLGEDGKVHLATSETKGLEQQ